MQYLNSTRSPLVPSSDFFGPHLVNLTVMCPLEIMIEMTYIVTVEDFEDKV